MFMERGSVVQDFEAVVLHLSMQIVPRKQHPLLKMSIGKSRLS